MARIDSGKLIIEKKINYASLPDRDTSMNLLRIHTVKPTLTIDQTNIKMYIKYIKLVIVISTNTPTKDIKSKIMSKYIANKNASYSNG